jgi:hypothetical protein
MARGWESKAVDEQIATAAANRETHKSKHHSPEQVEMLRQRKVLELSRARVTCDLENSQDPRYRSLLLRALEDLEAQIAGLQKAV